MLSLIKMLVKNKLKNYINIEISHNAEFYKVASSFNVNSLKKILFNWNIVFFKFINLKKSKDKNNIANSLIRYNNTYYGGFLELQSLLIFFKNNNHVWKNKINVLHVCYNGYFLNFKKLEIFGFQSNLLTQVYFIFFLQKLVSLWVKMFFFFITKLLFYIKYNFSKCF